MSGRGEAAPRRPAPAGQVLFARYAYPPNQLGYCGAGDGRELLELAADPGSPEAGDMGARARGFDGAWPYLEIIAAAAGIRDPLDRRVVEAYWVGNELLDAVDPDTFARSVRRSFAGQTGADWDCLPAGPAAHHSFHVLAVYPWMGLLRRGAPGPALEVLDRCRIRWGQVTARRGDHVEVTGQALTWDGSSLGLGPPREETVRWADGGRSLSGPAAPGAWVALHWDWVCDRLTGAQLDDLRRFTLRQLDVTNRVAAGSAP
jgi:Family of unknown function (DUF6390)